MDFVSLIERILTSTAGSLGFVLALLLLAGWLIHWVTKKVTQIQESHKQIVKDNEKTCDKVEKHAEKMDGHMDEIRKDISYLKAMIDVYKFSPSDALAQSHSPVSLTEMGNKVATEIDADGMIASNWENILAMLEDNVAGKNAYDIQEYCLETAIIELEKFLDTSSIEKMKNIAYNSGHPLAYYAPIFGIKIRDKYLEIKGISVEEIDKHDPGSSVQE